VTQREVDAAYVPLLQRETRVTRALVHAQAALQRRPTSRNAERVGRVQIGRAKLNADLGALNAEADRHADEMLALAFDRRRAKPKLKPRPEDDEEKDQ
jgi:hypothetical protein